MIDLVDNIGVLIDETVEIPDIDKEDEFIIQIHDPILNEGLDYQLEGAGIILERASASSTLNERIRQEPNLQHGREFIKGLNKAKQDQLDKNFDDAEKADTENRKKWQVNKDFDEAEKADTENQRNHDWTEPGAQSSAEDLKNAASRTAIRNSSDSFWQKRQNTKERNDAEVDKNFDDAEKADTANQRTYDMNKKADARYKEGEFKELAKTGQGFDDYGEKDRGFMGAISDAVKANPMIALGGAVIAAAGGYLIYRYMNSIYRLNKATNYYSKLASSTSDPAKKAKYQQKASTYANRLESAKAKARENKKDYIAKTKEMQSRYGEMKKSGGDAKELAKMEKKLSARNKLLSKIGAI